MTDFWITNVSNMNVVLSDLALSVKPYTSVNLLDKKHYNYTPEQLVKSQISGSLFKKRNKIFVRGMPPSIIKNDIPFIKDAIIPSRERSILVIKEEEYAELKFDAKETQKKSDEEYAEENAELAEIDIQKTINFKKV